MTYHHQNEARPLAERGCARGGRVDICPATPRHKENRFASRNVPSLAVALWDSLRPRSRGLRGEEREKMEREGRGERDIILV